MNSKPEGQDPRYLEGISLFNRGEYFEAHEIWEALWRDCPEFDRRFYQSLIQAAVALYHLSRGNLVGANRLAKAGHEKMTAYDPTYRGIDKERFWTLILDQVQSGRLHEPSPSIELSEE